MEVPDNCGFPIQPIPSFAVTVYTTVPGALLVLLVNNSFISGVPLGWLATLVPLKPAPPVTEAPLLVPLQL